MFSFVFFIIYVSLRKSVLLKRLIFFVKVWQIWKATMILCFSLLCVLHSTEVCDIKIGTPKKVAGNFQTPKIVEILWSPKKRLKNLQRYENRIWSNSKPKKIGQASTSKFLAFKLPPSSPFSGPLTKQTLWNFKCS